jgi:hypothetical protein
VRRCGQVCGSGSDETLASIGWNVGTCPNFESGACTNSISHCGDVATCPACVGNAAVDQAIGLYYDHLRRPRIRRWALPARSGGAPSRPIRPRTKRGRSVTTRVSRAAVAAPPDPKTNSLVARRAKRSPRSVRRAGRDGVCSGSGDLDVDDRLRADLSVATIPGGTACGGTISDLRGL